MRIKDELHRTVKERAARSGRTVGELIEDAIRQSVATLPPAPKQLTPLPVFGGGGVLPGVDLSSNQAVRDIMDGLTDGGGDLGALR